MQKRKKYTVLYCMTFIKLKIFKQQYLNFNLMFQFTISIQFQHIIFHFFYFHGIYIAFFLYVQIKIMD
jgi:heme A synthase